LGRTVEFCALAVPESHNLLKTSSNFSKINYEFASIAKDSAKNKKLSYICGLRTRIECERGGEHSTHSDRVTNIGWLLAFGASLLSATNHLSMFMSGNSFLHRFFRSKKLYCNPEHTQCQRQRCTGVQ